MSCQKSISTSVSYFIHPSNPVHACSYAKCSSKRSLWLDFWPILMPHCSLRKHSQGQLSTRFVRSAALAFASGRSGLHMTQDVFTPGRSDFGRRSFSRTCGAANQWPEAGIFGHACWAARWKKHVSISCKTSEHVEIEKTLVVSKRLRATYKYCVSTIHSFCPKIIFFPR